MISSVHAEVNGSKDIHQEDVGFVIWENSESSAHIGKVFDCAFIISSIATLDTEDDRDSNERETNGVSQGLVGYRNSFGFVFFLLSMRNVSLGGWWRGNEALFTNRGIHI